MKKTLFFALFVASISHTFATIQLESRIHLLDLDDQGPDLVYLTTGEVVRITNKDSNLREAIHSAIEKKSLVGLSISDKKEILSLQSLPDLAVEEIPSTETSDYQPTIINSYNEVESLFMALKPNSRRSSECFNRAHVWSYEMFQKNQIKSMKMFIFFTRKYIREHNFSWWFHVAPFTYMKRYNEVVEKVLDFSFTKIPANTKSWTDVFMKNKVNCPVITKYSDYSQHQEEEWCYLFKTSMYYYGPRDLEDLEETGAEKTDWVQSEINTAYSQGFTRRN